MKNFWKRALSLAASTLLGLALWSPAFCAPFVYITNSGDNTVSVIDTSTNTVTATIPVGLRPLGAAVHPQGKYAYIANYNSNTVSIIDAAKNTVINTIPVGTNPYGIAVDAAGTFAYVTNSGSNTVSKIDLSQKTVTSTIPVGSGPIGIVASPSGPYVYVANNLNHTVSVINTTSNSVTATVTVGQNPIGLAVLPSGAFVYVANSGSSSVSVINTTTNTVTNTITSVYITTPWGIAVNPKGTYGYIASYSGDRVSVFDTATYVITGNVSVGKNPIGTTVLPAGTYTYVANSADNTVSVLDNLTNTLKTQVQVGTSPYALGIFTAAYGPTPSVVSTLPASNAGNIALSPTIQATFSYTIDPLTNVMDPLSAMDPTTITPSTFLLSGGITGTVTYDSVNRIATFKPATALTKGTTYTATLTTDIKNVAGNPLAANYTWSFSTTAADSSSGCFIATAVYGSYHDFHVEILRAFRDEHLLPHAWGAAMVSFYYRHSPPIANFIKDHDALKTPMRWLLTPVVHAIQYPAHLLWVLGLGLIMTIGKNKRTRRRLTNLISKKS